MILIHVTHLTERWRYTLSFVFDMRNLKYEITDSKNVFNDSNSLKFSFEKWSLGSILSELGTTKQRISKSSWQEIDCLAFDEKPDPISSIFYVLTRMEEYANTHWDKHNRFAASSSLQYQYGWLETCICDHWAEAIISAIGKAIGYTFQGEVKSGQFIPTFDIDNTYAYKLKKGKRKLLAMAKDLVYFNSKRFMERKAVLSGKKKDPYDTFDYIESIGARFPTKLFWLVGDYGSFDKNSSIEIKEHTKLVKQLRQTTEIGIHPSYTSNSIPSLLKSEKLRLEEALLQKVEISRQHFLKLKFPFTYQNLIAHGLKEDFTMGFADAVGFRNGTAHSFPWFDLSSNVPTELIIRPFAYMDGTLNEYLKIPPEKAKRKIKQLFEEVEHKGGDFIFLWHNETIGEYGIWKGWRSVLEYTLSLNSTIT